MFQLSYDLLYIIINNLMCLYYVFLFSTLSDYIILLPKINLCANFNEPTKLIKLMFMDPIVYMCKG